MKFSFVLYYIGALLCFNGLLMLLSVSISLYYAESIYWQWLLASGISVFSGLPLLYFFRNYDKNIRKKEGYLIVTLGWITMILSGTLPYLCSGAIPNFVDALFESSSGYTTTGATIVDNVEILPKSILFWRSLTHWIGGMGIIVLFIAILPLLGIGGMQLFSAEASGIKTDKLHPRITQTAKVLWGIYCGYTLVETLLLWWAGMDLFDAVNHSFSTLASGGFSTKNASVAYWNNVPAIQYIILFFMFLAGTNFVLSYFLLKGEFKKIWQDDEFKAYVVIIVLLSVCIGVSIYFHTDFYKTEYHPQVWGRAEAAFRHAFFQVVSIITTTGFITSDYTAWGTFLQVMIFGLLFFGACAGSTSGGIKIVRHLLMLKNGILEFKRALHPSAIIPTRLNGRTISRNIMYNVIGFFVLYMALFTIGALLLAFLGNDFQTAMSASATTLGNAGPGLGQINPMTTFNSLSTPTKTCCSFLMLVGRLELFTVLILVTPYFWKRG